MAQDILGEMGVRRTVIMEATGPGWWGSAVVGWGGGVEPGRNWGGGVTNFFCHFLGGGGGGGWWLLWLRIFWGKWGWDERGSWKQGDRAGGARRWWWWGGDCIAGWYSYKRG